MTKHKSYDIICALNEKEIKMNLTELYAKADYQDEMGMLFHDDCMNIMNDLKFTAERE